MTAVIGPERSTVPNRDRIAFEVAPIAMWQEDFSGVAEMCDQLRSQGVTDLRSRLESDRELLKEVVSRIEVVDVNDAVLELVGVDDRDQIIGPLPPSLVNDEAYSSFVEQTVAVWEGRSHQELELIGAQFSGARIDCTLHWAAPVVDGAPDYSRVVVMIRNVTDQTRTERKMREHARQLGVLLEVGRQITSSFDLDTVLQRIVDATVELLGTDESLILLVDRETESLTQAVGRHYPELELATHTYREVVDGISGWVMEQGRATISEDIATDGRNKAAALERARRFPGTSVAVAPIIADGVVMGTLTALNNPPSEPVTSTDLSLIATLASQAAVAIQNARLYDEIHSAHQELKETQAQLLQAQKLESIGSLAAGIAHEINTPIQYVADNTRFLIEAADANASVLDAVGRLVAALEAGGDGAEAMNELETVKEEADFDFIVEEVPIALQQTLEGVDRVAEIVRAMKEFAHPGSENKASVDLNRALQTTAEISRSEWKYVADLEFDLDEKLPLVPALSGPLNQAFLIIIVNAAQAIEASSDVVQSGKGRIEVKTRLAGDHVEVRFTDSGPGVPPEILERIYDPFFTTKEVGKGSGQGLSIARSVVVEQHGGELAYDDSGPGATFVMRLPLDQLENDPS